MPEQTPGNFAGPDTRPLPGLVVPRARREGASSSLPLAQLISPFLLPKVRGVIAIVAPPGGGKTNALRLLRTVLPESSAIRFFDTDAVESPWEAAQSALVILAAHAVIETRSVLAKFELSPWTIDDCMEYLVAQHRQHVQSILGRLSSDSTFPILQGSPELMALVMDEMAADPTLATSMAALSRFVANRVPSASSRDDLMDACCRRLGFAYEPSPRSAEGNRFPATEERWFRHKPFQQAFAGQWIAERLSQGVIPYCLYGLSPRSILPQIASAIASRSSAIDTLENLTVERPNNPAVAAAASILLSLNPAWRPSGKGRLNLVGAILRSAKWAGIDLSNARLHDADFTNADLREANLSGVEADRVQMTGANLRGAQIIGARLAEATFVGANLANADLERSLLWRSDFTGANLTAANIPEARFEETVLQNAILKDAYLSAAWLEGCNVDGVDFRHVDLSKAHLIRLRMSEAKWDHVSFRAAQLLCCNMEGLEIEGPDFTRADLTGSLLTGTRISDGLFAKAKLVKTGLADIEWEYADLQGADLTHASFHLGSSRSGLVGSNIPCEGSRTGFYTDEFNEQDFKAPEEIRKACLCGADLRGAKVEETDFYLVDLRGANYTVHQRRHFARCGAILVSRVT